MMQYRTIVIGQVPRVGCPEHGVVQVAVSWDAVAGIQDRVARRGLARRKRKPSTRIGVDETSFHRRHEYVTVVNDLDTAVVLYVADDRLVATKYLWLWNPEQMGRER
jgi:transposase